MASENSMEEIYNQTVYVHQGESFSLSDAVAIANVLRCSEGKCIMEELEISDTDMTDEEADPIITALITNTTVQRVEFHGNDLTQLTQQIAVSLARVLKTNKTITSVSLMFTESETVDGALAFVEALKTNTTLQHLECFNVSEIIRDTGCWSDVIELNSTLKSLTISGYGLNVDSVTRMADALTQNTSLEDLFLNDNNLGDGEAIALAGALEINETLSVLRLADLTAEMRITSTGASYIAANLPKYKGLQTLQLRFSSLRYDGLAAISEALAVNKTGALVSLNLLFCDLGSTEAQVLAGGLKRNRTIEELILSANPLKCDGVTWLAEALQTNSTLSTLDLEDTQMKASGAVALANMLTKNSTLKLLLISENEIGETGAAALVDAMERNTTLEEVVCHELGTTNGAIFAAAAARHVALQSSEGSEDLHCSVILAKYCARNIQIQIAIRAVSAVQTKQTLLDSDISHILSTTFRGFQKENLCFCFPLLSSSLIYSLLRKQTPTTAMWTRVQNNLRKSPSTSLQSDELNARKRKVETDPSPLY